MLPHLWDAIPHGGRAPFAGGGCGHSGCCLHDGGGHISQRGGGAGVGREHRGHVAHQPQVALGLDAGVALGCQFEHLQAVVVQAWHLALEVAPLLSTTNFNERLAVEDCQLATWWCHKSQSHSRDKAGEERPCENEEGKKDKRRIEFSSCFGFEC